MTAQQYAEKAIEAQRKDYSDMPAVNQKIRLWCVAELFREAMREAYTRGRADGRAAERTKKKYRTPIVEIRDGKLVETGQSLVWEGR